MSHSIVAPKKKNQWREAVVSRSDGERPSLSRVSLKRGCWSYEQTTRTTAGGGFERREYYLKGGKKKKTGGLNPTGARLLFRHFEPRRKTRKGNKEEVWAGWGRVGGEFSIFPSKTIKKSKDLNRPG